MLQNDSICRLWCGIVLNCRDIYAASTLCNALTPLSLKQFVAVPDNLMLTTAVMFLTLAYDHAATFTRTMLASLMSIGGSEHLVDMQLVLVNPEGSNGPTICLLHLPLTTKKPCPHSNQSKAAFMPYKDSSMALRFMCTHCDSCVTEHCCTNVCACVIASLEHNAFGTPVHSTDNFHV